MKGQQISWQVLNVLNQDKKPWIPCGCIWAVTVSKEQMRPYKFPWKRMGQCWKYRWHTNDITEKKRTKPVQKGGLLVMFQGASQSAVPFVSMHGHLCVHWCACYSPRLHASDKGCVVFKIWWLDAYCEETVVPISIAVAFGGSSRLLFTLQTHGKQTSGAQIGEDSSLLGAQNTSPLVLGFPPPSCLTIQVLRLTLCKIASSIILE